MRLPDWLTNPFTRRSRDQESLRHANEALEKASLWAKEMAAEAMMANAAKTSFLARMSHEIRTPLSGILGTLDLLFETDLTEEQRELTTVSYRSAEGLLEIINEILDFSKIESGRLELEEIDLDLGQTVEEAVEALATRADAKGLDLVMLVDPEVPVALRGDPTRLRQLLLNLLSNAIKFTERGEVYLKVALEGQDQEAVRLRFSIQDSGIGIPPEARGRLFQDFSQAEDSTSRRFGGTGLGLAISRRLAMAMGGDIGLESEPGKGSTFWFTASLRRRTAIASIDDARGQLAGWRALVVDDSPASRDSLTRQLSFWGAEVSAAEDAATATEALGKAAAAGHPFQCVLVDYGLPGCNGLSLARSVRDDSRLGSPELVLLTTFGQRYHRKEAEEAGITAHLTKPVRRGRLAKVSRAQRRRSIDGPLPSSGSNPAEEEEAQAGAPPQRALRPAAAADTQGDFGSARVLLAEDNPVNQKVATWMLERMGLHVEIVSDGHQAVEAVQRGRYDLILMDHQMPVMDGCQAAEQIRAWEESRGDAHAGSAGAGEIRHCGEPGRPPRIPIVALTANAAPGDRERYVRAGMDDHLAKPFNKESLHAMVCRWIPAPADAGDGRRAA